MNVPHDAVCAGRGNSRRGGDAFLSDLAQFSFTSALMVLFDCCVCTNLSVRQSGAGDSERLVKLMEDSVRWSSPPSPSGLRVDECPLSSGWVLLSPTAQAHEHCTAEEFTL